MRWILQRWFLAGGFRSFLGGYAGLPLLLGLLGAIVVTIHYRSAEGLIIVPGVLIVCCLAPLGLILGMVRGLRPEWWGPWDGRLVFMGLIAWLVVLAIVGLRLEKHYPVPDGGDGASRVPAARVVPTTTWNRLIGRLVTVPWKQLIGPALLVIAGVGFICLGCAGVVLGRHI